MCFGTPSSEKYYYHEEIVPARRPSSHHHHHNSRSSSRHPPHHHHHSSSSHHHHHHHVSPRTSGTYLCPPKTRTTVIVPSPRASMTSYRGESRGRSHGERVVEIERSSSRVETTRRY
ncbi:hypothetical protein QC762_108710 [Podospora pseudocomata]|uniref:Uncharacterized protein n=1 Tax=Podospora pseudocomata TaxID=2093779 RepID=A0ABR0GU68_9PEZI|nr:hypothetical protein QC762_108710 [Podospora pseudocomata]